VIFPAAGIYAVDVISKGLWFTVEINTENFSNILDLKPDCEVKGKSKVIPVLY
jgi:hypothetical protein